MNVSLPNRLDTSDDAAIAAIQRDNPAWKVEISAKGRILCSPLTGTETGPKEGEAFLQLAMFARTAGGKAYPSSTGFRLPDKSVLGPDAAWISPERLAALPIHARKGYWRLCPDVVIEVASEWDSWASLQRKIGRFIRNGAVYAVAVDHERRAKYERGTPPPGLQLDFERIFDA